MAAQQILSTDARVDQAADVAVLLVECAVMPQGIGRDCTSYTAEMQARIHRPKVGDEILDPQNDRRNETNNDSMHLNNDV